VQPGHGGSESLNWLFRWPETQTGPGQTAKRQHSKNIPRLAPSQTYQLLAEGSTLGLTSDRANTSAMGDPMSSGEKDETVINCVNHVLISHGWSSPIDPNGTMGGYYKYKPPLMIAFHNQVAICLASKGYDYEYPHDNAYMAKTLALTLLALYGTIDSQTRPDPRRLERIATTVENLQATSATLLPVSQGMEAPDGVLASKKKPKRRRSHGAKRTTRSKPRQPSKATKE
jgi:hypothetical protein